MTMKRIELDPTPAPALALFELGFRPFFLCAACGAVIFMCLWLLALVWPQTFALPDISVVWHQHEMLFGYTTAVIAGFLLTAVPNWTKHPPLTGLRLAALVGLWLAGRMGPWLLAPDFGGWVDVSFLALLALVVGIPIWHSRQGHNAFAPAILLVMALANLATHAPALGWGASGFDGHQLALGMVVVLILILVGRLIPMFSLVAYGGRQRPARKVLGQVVYATALGSTLAKVFFPESAWVPTLSLLAAAALGWRLIGWYARGIWSEPLLWTLHLACAWIAVGFGMEAIGISLAVHAFTAGGIGLITFGMLVRVSLGHTGRMMRASKRMTLACVLVGLMAISRVVLPMVWPNAYLAWLLLSGGLWITAFSIFLWEFFPVLVGPRVWGAAR